MLLTRKPDSAATSTAGNSAFVSRLQRGLSQAIPTLDRRGFLRRSGLGIGVGLAATQLSLVKKAQASGAVATNGSGKIEVKRTEVDGGIEHGFLAHPDAVLNHCIHRTAH